MDPTHYILKYKINKIKYLYYSILTNEFGGEIPVSNRILELRFSLNKT
jgi:hypothetical protein